MREREVKKAVFMLKAIQNVIINHRVYFPRLVYKKMMVNLNFLVELLQIERETNVKIYARKK